MKIEKLTKMANEIGSFFAAEPDPAVAAQGVADHLRRFWDPRMRRQLLQWLEETGGEGLRPLVRDALLARKEQLLPPSAAE
jgi:formate dehydrogenase subunit delta